MAIVMSYHLSFINYFIFFFFFQLPCYLLVQIIRHKWRK